MEKKLAQACQGLQKFGFRRHTKQTSEILYSTQFLKSRHSLMANAIQFVLGRANHNQLLTHSESTLPRNHPPRHRNWSIHWSFSLPKANKNSHLQKNPRCNQGTLETHIHNTPLRSMGLSDLQFPRSTNTPLVHQLSLAVHLADNCLVLGLAQGTEARETETEAAVWARQRQEPPREHT